MDTDVFLYICVLGKHLLNQQLGDLCVLFLFTFTPGALLISMQKHSQEKLCFVEDPEYSFLMFSLHKEEKLLNCSSVHFLFVAKNHVAQF